MNLGNTVLNPTWLFLMHHCMLTALRILQLRGLFNLLKFGVSGTYLIPEHLFCVNISHPLVENSHFEKCCSPLPPDFVFLHSISILFSLSCTSNIAAGLLLLEDNLSFATFHLKSHHCSCADYTMKSTHHHGLALSSVILPTMPFPHFVLQPNWTIHHIHSKWHFVSEVFADSRGERKSMPFVLLPEFFDHASCVAFSIMW